MHILIVIDNFYPETNAPANRALAHAEQWVKAGHEVTVITCQPNFPKGKLHTGYRNRFRQTEHLNGIRVVRIWSYIAPNAGLFRRLIDFISFGMHSIFHGIFMSNVDVIIGSSPQPFAAVGAYTIALLKRKPFVFEVRDLWPESIIEVGHLKNGILLRCLRRVINHLYHKAKLIVCVTDSSRQHISRLVDRPDKICVIKNGIHFSHLPTLRPREAILNHYNLPKNKILAGYVGTMGMAHHIETIFHAANIAPNKFHFVIMGEGAARSKITELINQNGLGNITLLPGGTRQEALNLLNAMDISIIHLRNTPLFKTVIPSKLSEAMALKKPIALGVNGEAQAILESAGAGVAFEPENPDALINALKSITASSNWQDNYGQAGYQYALKHFDRDNAAHALLKRLLLL